MKLIILLGVAGALGALSRYALGGAVERWTGTSFPYGTLVINVLGCLIIGYFMQFALTSEIISPDMRLLVTIGFLGAFTTFSSFSYETAKLLEDGQHTSVILNIAMNVGLGLAATWLGTLLARITLRG
ncbi:MAG: fluoride efflux transporter CrcB [Dehalococcoidales bacterium]|nr:fluoride efflux transporter CrcB [Dehalococcoidales bacterium]